ncbi:M57 family metalloprotease [Flavisolibacter nicotianae]|uniref:M57 family metalloprotease n=1 Tax=Flavisolibacter nicotianae TaxID=2364882 RepID=UPI000EAD726E|nr:M57 family metalloprotease [Flavisolibacter nicotianae]
MKKLIRPFAAVCAAVILLASCKKDAKDVVKDTVSVEALSQIQHLGFSTDGVQKASGGYLVEGDIFLSDAQLSTSPTSPNMVIANEEHYHTFNMVNVSNHPTIKIALNNSSAQHDAAFSAALDEAISRYNNENLTVKFQRVTTGADITVVAFYEVSNTLGSSGFPNSAGDPYNQVKMNTYWYSTGTDATNVNYIGTIMAHEVGHCIGFRHTDYMNRAYSCGGRKQNEGQSNTGVGAVYIPGTPTGGDPNSWMLACVGSNVNRPFNANDKIALSYVY